MKLRTDFRKNSLKHSVDRILANKKFCRFAILFLAIFVIPGIGNVAKVFAGRLTPPTNFFYQRGSLCDISDPIGDDKGTGFYQYPLDSRLRRGQFDLKRFTVYEEGDMITFSIQIRDNILNEWPDTHKSEEQGFVAQMFDIYIDMDKKKGSGYQKAMPGRDLYFADEMGWEKMILVTPLSQFKVYEILKGKTDDLEFQNWLNDIVLPDYVHIQGDKLIVKIPKHLLGKPNSNWGYQCFVMGYSHVVSVNRLLNRDVRAFATRDDFGGGWDTYGDPTIIDCIMPPGRDQYKILKEYRSQPFREEIEYAHVPFVYPFEVDGDAEPNSETESFTSFSVEKNVQNQSHDEHYENQALFSERYPLNDSGESLPTNRRTQRVRPRGMSAAGHGHADSLRVAKPVLSEVEGGGTPLLRRYSESPYGKTEKGGFLPLPQLPFTQSVKAAPESSSENDSDSIKSGFIPVPSKKKSLPSIISLRQSGKLPPPTIKTEEKKLSAYPEGFKPLSKTPTGFIPVRKTSSKILESPVSTRNKSKLP